MSLVYDAVIMGGGPAGSTVALLLARAGLSVVVVERQSFPRRKVCGEHLSATNLPLLDRLGVGTLFREMAGPPVRKVGLFAGATCLQTDLPLPREATGEFGRALGRERLDALLLERARHEGAEIRQPWSVIDIRFAAGQFPCLAKDLDTGMTEEFSARLAIAAHGSWNAGSLPTQPPRQPAAPGDLSIGGGTLPRGCSLPKQSPSGRCGHWRSPARCRYCVAFRYY